MKTTLSQLLLFTFLILIPALSMGQQSIDQKLAQYEKIGSGDRTKFRTKHISLGLEIIQKYRSAKKFEAALEFGCTETSFLHWSNDYEAFHLELGKEIQLTLDAIEGQQEFEPVFNKYWALYNRNKIFLFTYKNEPSKTQLPKYIQDLEIVEKKYGHDSRTYAALSEIYHNYLFTSPALLIELLESELKHFDPTGYIYKEYYLEVLFCQIRTHQPVLKEPSPKDLKTSHNWYFLYLDSIEQLSSRDHKIHKQASTYVKEQYYSTNKELDFFFRHHSRIKRELKEKNTSFWERSAISIFSTFEQSAKEGNSMSPIFRQVLNEYNLIAESTLKKQTYGDDWLSYKLSRLKGFCGANNPDEKNFEQYVQYIVAIQTHSGIDSRGAKEAWSILKKDFPLAGTLFNQLIDWQIKNLEKNWTEKDSSTLELRIKELYAEKLGAAVHSYKPKLSTEQEISVSYAWYATQIDSIETLIGANRSLFEKANLQLSKKLFEQLDYSSLGLEDNMIRILVTTEWPITVERGRFWNALGAYFSTIEKYPLKKDWLGNQIQKNRVEHDKKIILYIKKQSKEAPIVFSKYWSKYFQLKIKSILNTEGSNEKTIAIFKNYLEEAESYFGLESALYVEFWDLIYYHTSHSIATKKMFLNWRIDRIKAYEKASYMNIPSPLLSQVAAEEIFHEIRIPTFSDQKHPMQPVDFDWYMTRLDSIVKHVGNKHWLTKKAWQRISVEFEEEHKYNLILKKWHFNTILDGAKTNLENLSPENKLIKADILLYGLTHCSPNKENPSLDYDWHNLQLDSIETLVGMQGSRFNKAWNVVSSRYTTDKAAKRRFLQLYLNKAEAISGFIDSPEAMFIIYSVVEFYKTESTSDEDLTKKLYVFRSKIAKHAPCSSDLELEETFMIVEQMPRFYGCEDIEGDHRAKKECADQIMLDFIYSNLNYPQLAKDNQIEGMAVINFTVTPCGTLTKLKILRDPGGGCGKEALRIMESMNYLLNKPWIAGKQRGRKVYVRYNIPIRFKLEKN